VSRLRCASISRRTLTSLGAGMPLRWGLRLTQTPTAAQRFRSPRHRSMSSVSRPTSAGDVPRVDPCMPPTRKIAIGFEGVLVMLGQLQQRQSQPLL
jgi:hypothetical protein